MIYFNIMKEYRFQELTPKKDVVDLLGRVEDSFYFVKNIGQEQLSEYGLELTIENGVVRRVSVPLVMSRRYNDVLLPQTLRNFPDGGDVEGRVMVSNVRGSRVDYPVKIRDYSIKQDDILIFPSEIIELGKDPNKRFIPGLKYGGNIYPLGKILVNNTLNILVVK